MRGNRGACGEAEPLDQGGGNPRLRRREIQQTDAAAERSRRIRRGRQQRHKGEMIVGRCGRVGT